MDWIQLNGNKMLDDTSEIEKDPSLDAVETKSESIERTRPNKGISTYIGKSVKDFTQQFGLPDRIDTSYYGYEVWIYNNDDNRYIQVGVMDQEVVTIVVIGEEVDATPFKIGESLESVYQNISLESQIELEFNEGIYRFELSESDLNLRPLISFDDLYAQLYFDNFSGNLLFVRFMDKETLLKHRPYDLTYWGTLIEPPELNDWEWRAADTATAKQIYEISNIIHKQYDLPLLEWDEVTANIAYLHSQDMYESETFSHVSEKHENLQERLDAYHVQYESAGENIASHYTDSTAVIAGWLNSKGHRDTFLNEEYTHIGVGVFKKFYTQNFIRQDDSE